MKLVIQRVSSAQVTVENNVIGKIKKGLLLFVGIEQTDKDKVLEIAEKILKLRIFGDENDKMNLSVLDIKGEILVIPQFTLIADTKQGNRPYFGNAAPQEISQPIFENLVSQLIKSGLKVETGIFGAKMEVGSTNNGPVTIIL